ncbi:MAG: T9SS type A sorting domain-containing protein [Bacteroidia bacterium]|nr:T9SS type A sorting domain-containing protein [Bacteroidia bacterium]
MKKFVYTFLLLGFVKVNSQINFCQPTISLLSSNGSSYNFIMNAPVGPNATYHWFWSGPSNGNTSTGNTPTISLNLTQNGVYNVCGFALDSAACQFFTTSCITVTVSASSSNSCTAFLNINVSNNNNVSAVVNVAPNNPTTGVFIWYLFGPNTFSTTTNTNTLNLNNLAVGVYDLCVAPQSVGCSNSVLTCMPFTITSNPNFCQPTISVVSFTGTTYQFSLSAPVNTNIANYQWHWNGPSSGSIQTGNSNTVLLNLSPGGVYWVCGLALDTITCPSYTASCISVTVGITGLETIKSNRLLRKYYPQPAESKLVVELEDASEGILKIYDVTGTLVKSIKFEKGNTQVFEVGDLQSGLYISEMEMTHNRKSNFRFIKE